MSMDDCLNCEERESNEQGVLCDECRADMWGDARTHHDEPIERTASYVSDSDARRSVSPKDVTDRTVEDVTRANGRHR